MTMSELSNRIVNYRAVHDLTLREFARLCGVSYYTIQKIEAGKYDGKMKRVTTIKILNVLKG